RFPPLVAVSGIYQGGIADSSPSLASPAGFRLMADSPKGRREKKCRTGQHDWIDPPDAQRGCLPGGKGVIRFRGQEGDLTLQGRQQVVIEGTSFTFGWTRRTERIEGPTPNGGAYALVYHRDDGSIEIVECDEAGDEIHRTYCPPSRGDS